MKQIIKCFKCKTETGTIIKHHTSYNPEVLVDCCQSCHQIIHQNLRKNNLCSLTVEEVHNLSKRSFSNRYNKINKKQISFSETLQPHIILFEQLIYNIKTNSIIWTSRIQAQHKKKIFYIGDK